MKGLGPAPGLAGRSLSYVVRQMDDMQQGARKGVWTDLMKPVVDEPDQGRDAGHRGVHGVARTMNGTQPRRRDGGGMKRVAGWLVAGALRQPFSCGPRAHRYGDELEDPAGSDRSFPDLRSLHYLTDVYGPRLTGSPNLKAASDWAVKQMQAWGWRTRAWSPGRSAIPGWTNQRFSGSHRLAGEGCAGRRSVAWTPGTNGTVTGAAVQIELPNRPTKEELTAALEALRTTVKGKIVLVGKPRSVAVTFNKPALRRESQDLRSTYDPVNPTPTPSAPTSPHPHSRASPSLTARQIAEQVDQFLVAAGAIVRINDAGRDHGQIRAFANPTHDPAKAVPTVVFRNED